MAERPDDSTELTGVIMDGAVPRSPVERLYRIEAEADFQLEQARDRTDEDKFTAFAERLRLLNVEMRKADNAEFAHEMEDSFIDFINDVLPLNLLCVLGETEPGTLVIRERDEEDLP